MNPVFIGVFFHWLGGLASGSFYVPFRFVRRWSWEVYWLAAGVMSWIIAPWVLASILTKGLLPAIGMTLKTDPSAIFYGFLFGMMWGVGGLTFGLTMRYLGMSLGMAVALGYCTVLGTLMPPIFDGTFVNDILMTTPGRVNLFGLAVCALGIAITAWAGLSKESEMSEEAKRATIKEFSFFKGMIIATISGVFSAGMAYGMAAAQPLSDLIVKPEYGTPELWSGLPKLCIILLGGFTSNFIWCVFLIAKNKTFYQFVTPYVKVSDEEAQKVKLSTNPKAPANSVRICMTWNYFFAMLAGLTWYMQFFFYSMGETKMGDFQFSSWTLHMASIIIFSTLWGIALKEWKGSSKKTMNLLFYGILTLLISTLIVGYSNYMKSKIPAAPEAVEQGVENVVPENAIPESATPENVESAETVPAIEAEAADLSVETDALAPAEEVVSIENATPAENATTAENVEAKEEGEPVENSEAAPNP